MNNKGLLTVIIVLLVVIIIAGGGIAWYLLTQSGQSQTTLPREDDLTGLLGESKATDWQVYTSNWGYLIKYPKDYFTPKPINDRKEAFTHVIKGPSGTDTEAGVINIERQPANIKDINEVFAVLEENIKKPKPGLEAGGAITNHKNITLESGIQAIEFDQSGLLDVHQVILLADNYLYSLNFISSTANSALLDHFSKMYPTIKFASDSTATEFWEEKIFDDLKLSLKIPQNWVTSEEEAQVSLVSPNQSMLVLSALELGVSLIGQTPNIVISLAGHTGELYVPVDTKKVPLQNESGSGAIEQLVFFSLKFPSPTPSLRVGDLAAIQEIIKTIKFID